MGTTSSTGSSIFTGSSEFSSDLQGVITKAVNIATLPITAMQNQQTTLTDQGNELFTLDSDFTGLQSAVQGIQTALSGSSMNADVSDSSAVGVTLANGAIAGDYSVQINDVGAYSTTLTNTWTGTSYGSPDTYVLSIGSQNYNITPTDNSATSVASAINSQYGNLVQATVVNVGSNNSPDYRLSLQSTNLTADTIDLTDNGTSLSAVQSAGAPVQYEINNSGVVVSSDTRTVDVATGVTLNLLATTDSAVDVNVTQSSSALNDAFSTFVSAYNTAQTELTNQRGQSGGALQGSELVNQLQQVLDGLVTYYSSSGASSGAVVDGLSDLGVTMNDDGSLTFDGGTALSSIESSNPADLNAFLGSATGGGFLESATNALTGLEDPTAGIVKTAETDYQNQISALSTQISTAQAQVSTLQTSLTNQMNSADAMIATMEQQYTYVSDMLQAQQIDDQAYQ